MTTISNHSCASTGRFPTPMHVVPTPGARSIPGSLAPRFPLGPRPTTGDPRSRALALQLRARQADGAWDPAIAERFGEAFGWRSGDALDRRLEALAVLEEAGAFTEALYRDLFTTVASVTQNPTALLVHAAGWEFFCGGVERTLASPRALGAGRAARAVWSAQPQSLLDAALAHAQTVVLFLTRELLAEPRFVREFLLAANRVGGAADGPLLAPRLQVVLFDDLPDLRGLPREGWQDAYSALASELGDPAVARVGRALRTLRLVAAAGSPPGEVARALLKSLGG